jgi:hypothetical protein
MPAIPYDRRATDLPANAILAEKQVEDPARYQTTVIVSIRDDPLGRLHVKGLINDAQFAGGRAWQRFYERSQLWPSAELKDPVDGTGRVSDPYVRIADASAMILKCAARLGETGDGLIRDVLGSRMFLAQVAMSRGLNPADGSHDMRYLGHRLRECLNTLAKVFGYA